MRAVSPDITGIAQHDLRLPSRLSRSSRALGADVHLPDQTGNHRARNPLRVLVSRAARLEAEHGTALALGGLIERMGGAPGSAARGDFLSARA